MTIAILNLLLNEKENQPSAKYSLIFYGLFRENVIQIK